MRYRSIPWFGGVPSELPRVVGVSEVSRGNATDPLECLGEGELVFVSHEPGDDRDAVAAGESLTGECHPPSPHVAERRLADGGTEAAGESGARQPRPARPVSHQRITPDEFTAILNQAGLPSDYAASVVSSQVAIAEGHGAVVTSAVRDIGAKQPVRFAEYAAAAAAAGAW